MFERNIEKGFRAAFVGGDFVALEGLFICLCLWISFFRVHARCAIVKKKGR